MSKQFYFKQFSLVWIRSLNAKSRKLSKPRFSYICLINRNLSGSTTLSQSGRGSDGNKGDTLHSPKLQHYWNLNIRLFSVICRTFVGGWSYPSAEMQSVYSITPADWLRLRCGKKAIWAITKWCGICDYCQRR